MKTNDSIGGVGESVIVSGEELIQIAFSVPDLAAAMDWWTDAIGIGPWFVLDRIGRDRSTYRGRPGDAEFTIAVALSGTLMIELIQALDDKPSVYKEARERRGHGFHHVGKFRPDVKQLAEAYEAEGQSIVFQAPAPGGGDVFFIDRGEGGPGFIELIDDNESTRKLSDAMRRASVGWKGERPIRSFAELLS
ncbi:VOC family protein [Bradyrhizobium sp. AUGA SZCCT0182]|uniref:VOC family protein n=1 Tax=Bradyrhizobium sp. AUGA SZCCT0182 TaxID=2807667 RepID=UPI001BA646D3|nr:VOC family protein [Bradyrhizobium sp. AUGA SZCCT0182]MBR1235898.1 VOC family protein [Bradyrhizobium sp. AUGA SZCCT0182]